MTTSEMLQTMLRIANCADLPAETRKTAKDCVNKILDAMLYRKELEYARKDKQ